MTQDNPSTRHPLIGAIFLLYMIPVLFLSGIYKWFPPHLAGWTVLAWGLLMAAVGSLAFFFLLNSAKPSKNQLHLAHAPAPLPKVEDIPSPRIPNIIPDIKDEMAALALIEKTAQLHQLEDTLEDCRQKQEHLIVEINLKNDELQKVRPELENAYEQLESLKQETLATKIKSQQQLEQKDALLEEYQNTIYEQREALRKRQQHVSHLESKIRDLTYEIETLLILNEGGNAATPSRESKSVREKLTFPAEFDSLPSEWNDSYTVPLRSSTVQTAGEAILLLKRCLNIANHMHVMSHFTTMGSRFGDLSSDNYALDLRRLFEKLRAEQGGTILFYSPKEEKLLFVHHTIKDWLGWNPEKFLMQFSDMVQGGIQEWKKGIEHALNGDLSSTQLIMKTRNGQDLPVQCHLGMISAGIFKNHILAVIFASHSHS